MNQVSPQQPAVTPDDPPPPKLYAVLTVTGEIWQAGHPVPGTERTLSVDAQGQEIPGTEGQQALIIREMFVNDDSSVEVFCLPVPGSAFDRQKAGVVETIYPLMIQRTFVAARFDVWKDMLEEAREAELGEDPEDPEPEEPSSPELPMTSAPEATPPNGAS
jgi:hypothetical protein